MSTPLVRLATEADAETVATVARETFIATFGHLYPPDDLTEHLRKSYTAAAFGALLNDPMGRLWLAEQDGRAIAFAQAGPCQLPHPEASTAHGELRRFYVVAGYQGTGLAQQMMTEVMGWIERSFEAPIWLGVYSENARAQRFYARFGFVRVGQYEYPVGKTRDLEFILRRG